MTTIDWHCEDEGMHGWYYKWDCLGVLGICCTEWA
jgi:hypothetical protein